MMTCKLNHNYWGLGITAAGAGWKLTTAVKKELAEWVAAKLGSKVIPIVGWATIVVALYCSIGSASGYNYTKFSVPYEKCLVFSISILCL